MREMVKIGEFEIDQHEVAVGRFRTFWESEDRAMPASVRYPDGTELVPPPSVDVRVPPSRDEVHDTDTWSFQPPIGNGYEHRPITGVDFWTALAFCAWEGGRLPTGAEWEYAARYREGRELASGEAFSGDDPPRTDESCGDIVWGRCDPLGRDPIRGVTTREGDLDRLSGNVAEWTADSFRPYSDPSCWPEGPLENPLCNVNDGADGLRTIRGGSYRSTDIDELRTASRIGVPANTQRDDIGFRCVRDVTR